jgi:hypothetical protein
VHRYDLGRRRNVLEQAKNVGIEYLDIDVELPGVGEDGTMALEEGLTAAALHHLLLRAIAGQRQVTIQMS